MTRLTVVLDACTLVPIRLATTMLWIAESGLFNPMWPEAILDEVERALPKVGLAPDDAARRINMMREVFSTSSIGSA